jgi:serine/threonine protein phosphatase PrpC
MLTNAEDLSVAEQMVTCIPDIGIHVRTPEDRFIVVACDGVWDVVENEEATEFIWQVLNEPQSSATMASILARDGVHVGNDSDDDSTAGNENSAPIPVTVLQAAQALVDISLQAGSTDNISVLISTLPPVQPTQALPSKKRKQT